MPAMSGLPGQDTSEGEHVCGMCHGKAAKRYWRVWQRRQKRREERRWRKEEVD